MVRKFGFCHPATYSRWVKGTIRSPMQIKRGGTTQSIVSGHHVKQQFLIKLKISVYWTVLLGRDQAYDTCHPTIKMFIYTVTVFII
jgi:hypothetical protein